MGEHGGRVGTQPTIAQINAASAFGPYETCLLYRRAQVKAGKRGSPLSPAIGLPLRKLATFSAA